MRWRWIWLAVLLLMVGYGGTLVTFGRWYGMWMVAEEGNGCVAIYWGGNKSERDSAVFNASEWPLSPETIYAGGEPPGWEWYGPWLELSPEMNTGITGVAGWRNRLGLKLPWYFADGDGRSVVMPVPVMIAVVTGLWWGRRWRGRRKNRHGFPVEAGEVGLR